jgi:hypothetical protein
MHVRVSLPTTFPAEEVAAYLARQDVVGYWLGDDALLNLTPGELCYFPRATRVGRGLTYGESEPAEVLSAGWGNGRFQLWTQWSASEANVRILVTPRPDGGGSYVRVVEDGVPDQEAAYCALRVWQGALNRLGRLLREAERKRNRVRQAVVVVHGIGEQRPGQTLRGFVEAVFPHASGQVRYAKPDYISPLFEMRTFSVPGDQSLRRPTTDVYELYWAHLIRDTTLGQVYSWMLRLFLSPRRRIPATLRRHVYVARAIVLALTVVVGLLVVTGTAAAWSAAIAAGALAFVPGLVWASWRFARNTLLLAFAGDAARYLEPKPGNIARRNEIRKAGVDLLEALHDSGRYERIVVYGHSLGSVIAYDILSRTWTRRSRRRREGVPDGPVLSSRALTALENVLNPRRNTRPTELADVRRLQHAAWREHQANGFSWLVTDFVTAGSPLAHARWLLNADKQVSFDDLVQERTFPTCPPVTEDLPTSTPGRVRRAFTFTHAYPGPFRNRSRSVQVPNHAALFALTRWTNLYFPLSGISRGDPVAGPLRDTFGEWVLDMPLEHPGGGIGGFAHTYYVAPKGSGSHLERLRGSLELEFSLPLEWLGRRYVQPANLG